MNKKVDTIAVVANPGDNGGESFTISIDFYDNGDPTNNIYMNQQLQLMSYGNMAVIQLSSAVFSPKFLRDLADRIDHKMALHRRG